MKSRSFTADVSPLQTKSTFYLHTSVFGITVLYFRTWIKFTIFAYLRTFQINKLTCAFCEVPWLFLQVLQFDWVRSEILSSSLLSFSIPPDRSLQVLIGPSTNRARHEWQKNMATWKISIVEELHHLSITQLRRE